MAITCNFEKDDRGVRKENKLIVRIPAAENIGSDTPGLKPKGGAYMWVMEPRRREVKSWRKESLN